MTEIKQEISETVSISSVNEIDDTPGNPNITGSASSETNDPDDETMTLSGSDKEVENYPTKEDKEEFQDSDSTYTCDDGKSQDYFPKKTTEGTSIKDIGRKHPIPVKKSENCFRNLFSELLRCTCCCCLVFSAMKRYVGEQYFAMKEAVMKTLVQLFILCRFRENSFEVNFSEMFICVTQFCAHFSTTFITGFWCLGYAYEEDFKWEYLLPVGVTLLSILIVDCFFVFGFVFKTKRIWLGPIVAIFMDYLILSAMVFSNNPIRCSTMVICYMLSPLFIISINAGYKVLWGLSFVILVFASSLYYIVRTCVEWKTLVLSPMEQLHIYILGFIAMVATGFFTLFFQWFLYNKLTSFQNMVTKIGNAIMRLNFDSPEVLKLMETSDKLCSSHSLLLKRIITNVQEYKTYLPQGLVMTEEEEEEIQNSSAVDHTTEHESNSSSIHSSSTGNSKNEDTSNSFSENRSVDSLEYEKKKKKRKRRGIDIRKNLINYSLQNRFGSMLLLDVNGWNDILEENQTELFVSYYTRLVEIVLEEMKKKKGIVITLQNDKILCGWNIKNVVVNHEINATSAACDIVKRLKSDIRLPLRVPVKVSVVTGNVTVGNMGCSQLKNFNYFGRKVNALYCLNKYAKADGQFCVLVDQRTREKVKYHFKSVFVNAVKCEERKFRIYKVTERCQNNDGQEWLYEISRGHLEKSGTDEEDFSSNDIYYLSQRLEGAYCAGDYSKAATFFKQFSDQLKMSLHEDLKNNIEEKKKYTVLKYLGKE